MRTVHCQFKASLYWQCCHCPGRTSLWMGPKFASNCQNRPESSLLSGVNGQSLIEEIILSSFGRVQHGLGRTSMRIEEEMLLQAAKYREVVFPLVAHLWGDPGNASPGPQVLRHRVTSHCLHRSMPSDRSKPQPNSLGSCKSKRREQRRPFSDRRRSSGLLRRPTKRDLWGDCQCVDRLTASVDKASDHPGGT